MGKTQVIPKQVVVHGPRSVGELLCEVDTKNELLPNINVNVRINSRERLNVLTVPRGAVEAQDGARCVCGFAQRSGVGKATLERREIHVGYCRRDRL